MKVNWERESGESIETFVASLIALEFSDSNRIRPSRGDRGVDVQVELPGGSFDIYQVKRYSSNLTSRQKAEIDTSWQTFFAQTSPRLKTNSWNLVLPLDATTENLAWLEAMGSGSGIKLKWIGLDKLDAWASKHSSAVDYFFGGSDSIVQDLLDQIFHEKALNSQVTSGEFSLTSAENNLFTIFRLLDKLDPFYRYEFRVKAGLRQSETRWHVGRHDRKVVSRYIPSPGGDFYIRLDIFERMTSAPFFHLIRAKFQGVFTYTAVTSGMHSILPGDLIQMAELVALDSEGPPGSVGAESRASVRIRGLPRQPSIKQIRTLGEAGDISQSLDITHSVWVKVDGISTLSMNLHSTLTFWLALDSNVRGTIGWRRENAHGLKLADVSAGEHLLEEIQRGSRFELLDQKGRRVLDSKVLTQPETSPGLTWTEVIDYLEEIQHHTKGTILIPDFSTVTTNELDELARVVRVLRGQTHHRPWTSFHVSILDEKAKHSRRLLVARKTTLRQQMTIKLGDFYAELEAHEKISFGTALVRTKAHDHNYDFSAISLDDQPMRSQVIFDYFGWRDVFFEWLQPRRHPFQFVRTWKRLARGDLNFHALGDLSEFSFLRGILPNYADNVSPPPNVERDESDG